MTDWKRAEEIYKKLMHEGDITWQESDVIFQIAYDCLCRKTEDEDCDKRRKFLEKWYGYDGVLKKLKNGDKGIYLHTVLLKPLKRFLMEEIHISSNSEIRVLLGHINKYLQNLKAEDKIVILVSKTREDALKLFKGKTNPGLMGRQYSAFDYLHGPGKGITIKRAIPTAALYHKYFFEIYRPLTLQRIGLDRFVRLDIEDEKLKAACVFYGCEGKVYNIQEAYERAIEIMLDMNVPIYSYSTELYYRLSDAMFGLLVDERYAKDIERAFRALPSAIDNGFFGTCDKNDEKFTAAVSYVVKDFLLFNELKNNVEEDDSWTDIIK
jgi:hypothetical protein